MVAKEEIQELLHSTETYRVERTTSTGDMDKFQEAMSQACHKLSEVHSVALALTKYNTTMKQILKKIKAAAMRLAFRPSTAQPQTARTVNINITPDGKAKMVGYLPEHPTGRTIIDCPGGGYNHLV